MKLSKLIVKNFRGLKGENNQIDFLNSDIVFLFGQNNVGKSTLLYSYDFFVDPKRKAVLDDFYDRNIFLPIEIEAHFKKEDNDEDDIELAKDGKNQDPDWIKKWVDSNNNIKIKKIWDSQDSLFKKESFDPIKKEWVENGFGGLHQNLTKYAPTPIFIRAMEDEQSLQEQVNKLINEEFIKSIKENHSEKCDEITEAIRELQKSIIDNDDIKSYNKDINYFFQKIFPDLTLEITTKDQEEIKLEDTLKKSHSINVRHREKSTEERFSQYGHGVIRQALFNFLTFIKKQKSTQKKEYLILFEEPEIFLHPKLIFNLRSNLYEISQNSPFQVLCASHSPLMIDVSKPHSSLVRISKGADFNTHTYQVGDSLFQRDEEMKAFIQMINRFNPHICEAFY